MHKNLFKNIALFLSVFIFAALIIKSILYSHFIFTPIIPPNKSFHSILKPGETLFDFANDMHAQGYLNDPKELITVAKFFNLTHKVKAGEYQFNAGTTPLQVLKILVMGDVVQHKITIVEGWTFAQMILALENNDNLQHDLIGLTPTQIMQKCGFSEEYPEGLFFPSTYKFVLGTKESDIVKMAYKTMQNKLALAWQHKDPSLNYQSPYQALIIASMIEKETSVDGERPLIAGIILNRLEKNMLLQIDPTVIYGLGNKYDGKLTHKNLKFNSPYNTYLVKGLPPTPISLPSAASIQAALHPTLSNYLFYVARGTGGHYFSATLQQHNKEIAKYRAYESTQEQPTSPLVKIEPVCDNIKITNAIKPLCSPCWYLPENLQFICEKKL